jgi:hypothetical protein
VVFFHNFVAIRRSGIQLEVTQPLLALFMVIQSGYSTTATAAAGEGAAVAVAALSAQSAAAATEADAMMLFTAPRAEGVPPRHRAESASTVGNCVPF